MTGVALAFVVAAAAGAVARASIGHRLNRAFPWGTLTVNVSGSFALGLLAHASTWAATVLGTGLLGAYTTISSFARDTVGLWELRQHVPAVLYVVASMAACIAAAWAGLEILA
jgi:CrcB protein